MSQSTMAPGLDAGATEIAAAVRDLAGQRLASVVMASCGELGARDSFVHGIETAWDLLGTAAPGAGRPGSVTGADGVPEVTITGTVA